MEWLVIYIFVMVERLAATGQRIGGKAIDFLEKKIDDALGEKTDKAPEAPAPAKPQGQESPKGQAL